MSCSTSLTFGLDSHSSPAQSVITRLPGWNLYLYLSNKCRKMDNVPVSLKCDSDSHSFRTIVCTHCGYKISVPIYCGNRFCPVCSVPRLLRVRRRLDWICLNITPPSGYDFKFLTLTIRNQSDLPEMLALLVKSFRRLRQRAVWKQYVRGGAFVLEVTGRPGNWHAHLHAVIEARYFPYDKILNAWRKVSGSIGVWIKRLPKKSIVGYLTKYLSKCSVPENLTDDVSDSVSGFRLFQPFGTWYAVNLTFQMPKPGCPECGKHCFYPQDILYRQLERDGVLVRAP
ncbi:hypothetical protein ES703_54089 [subsurface metagenome]